jgi:hypothetical protein
MKSNYLVYTMPFNPLRPNRTIRHGIFRNFSEVIPSLNSKWKMPYKYNELYSKPIHNKLINLLDVLLVLSKKCPN